MNRHALRSLYGPSTDRFLSVEACKDMLQRIVRLSSGGGDVQIYVRSRWAGNVRWARNTITTAGETMDNFVEIQRWVRGAFAWARTSRIDDAGIRECLERAEYLLRFERTYDDVDSSEIFPRSIRFPPTDVWSDATFDLNAEARAEIQRELVEPAVTEGLHSAGYLEVSGAGNGILNTAGLVAYMLETRAEYSVTVRNASGTGSGWAGVDNKDWRAIEAPRISSIALDKCTRSADPVAIEPGRYTVILEPQAVAVLAKVLVDSLNRQMAEAGVGPWADQSTAAFDALPPDVKALGPIRMSKIGQRVLDSRITISADPADKDAPFIPFDRDAKPYRSVTWIENGVLRNLPYYRDYAISALNRAEGLHRADAFRMSGGTMPLDEMIRTTERGLLITRFVNTRLVDINSMLCAGTTSDGVWLIENGRITKAVKNFRFRESPMFAFNRVDIMGPPVRVLADAPTIVPAMRVRDFSLTSLADAV